MKVNITLMIADGHTLDDIIEIEEPKLGELTDEEIEAAIEIRIRSWVDQNISVAWEVRD